MEDLRISTSDVDLAALATGPSSGRLVLMLHGFPDTPMSLVPMMQELAERGYRCVAPWMRGYWPSGGSRSGDYSLAALAADVDALLEALDARDAVVFGHDWGAAAVLNAAAAESPRFVRAIAASVPPLPALASSFVRSPRQLVRSRYMAAMQLPGAASRLRADNFAWVRRLWIAWSPSLNPPEPLIAAVRESLGPEGCAEAAVSYYRGLVGRGVPAGRWRQSLRLAFGDVRVRTLLVSGEEDGCIGRETFGRALRALPSGSELVVIPTAGHFVPVEAPSALAALVHRFAETP